MNAYYQRAITPELLSAARDYPVVTITGPRQSGKTTLVRHAFPEKAYVNLESLDLREAIRQDPRAFLSKYTDGAIFDEIQRVPELLSYIQVLVDESQKKGLFILTGSHQQTLHHSITQSLAGRTAILHLLPLSQNELVLSGIDAPLDEALLQGGFPRVFHDHLDPNKAYRNYFQTYVERDLRELIHIKNLSAFQTFIRMCAGRIGQIVKLESLSNDVGVSANTIKEWISILEASFILFRLQPYYENFGKRMIKSPKLYFTDVGLACYLLGIETKEQVARDPLRGQLVENLVILELFKARFNQGRDPQLYYLRDVHGHEIDAVFQHSNQLIPIEVKAAQTFNKDFLKNLFFFQELVGSRCSKGFLIYTGDIKQSIHKFEILNYRDAATILPE